MLKQGDIIEYTAQAYGNGETVGAVDGVTVFAPYLVVGETAKVRINYAKKNVAYADVLEVISPSSQRVLPPCVHFGKCGGCSLMHMSYNEQLAFKRNKVSNNLQKIAKLNIDVLPCQGSNMTLHYRNKLSLPVSGKIGRVKIGMYRKGTHDVVDLEDCLLAEDWAKTLTRLFKRYLNENRIAPYNEKTFQGEVRHLVARYVDGQLLVVIVSNGKFTRSLSQLEKTLAESFPHFGLFVNENSKRNNVILGDVTKHICGQEYIEGTHLGVKYRLRPNSFFQVNNGIKDAIYLKVKELLDISNTQVLVDCFSGIGILTNVLASSKYLTYAVEIEESAVRDATEMQRLNNSNVVNICGDVNVELPKITQKHAGQIMSLVVDPPRKGLGENICKTILSANFDNIVYVSCDSATLARDLTLLSSQYRVSYIQPFDMFPQTDQVETVVCLARKAN